MRGAGRLWNQKRRFGSGPVTSGLPDNRTSLVSAATSIPDSALGRRALPGHTGTVLICINAEPEAVEHDQATRLPDACRWRSRRVAVCGARAADVAGDRVFEQYIVRPVRALRGRIPPGPERNRLCRRPERNDRVPLGGGSI